MFWINRCGPLIRSFYSVYQSCTQFNMSILVLPKRNDFLRLSSSSTKQENHPNTSFVDQDQRIKLIKLEMALIREYGGNVPDVLTKRQWDELLALKSKSARRKYFSLLFSSEQFKKNESLKKRLQKEMRETRKLLEPQEDERHSCHSLGKNTFFIRVGKATMTSWRNNRLRRAMQFGEKLVFDCSYDEYMTNLEAKSTAAQLRNSFVYNRNDKDPFDLQFCNVNFNGATMQQLEYAMPNLRNKKLPINLHDGSYLELFPIDQLVYLTPHCQNYLTEYDPNIIYIIGAMVDKTNHEALSLGKAKTLNLKMARLPLEPNSHKLLELDQMVKVMLDLKRTGKWEIALRHVRKRKMLS